MTDQTIPDATDEERRLAREWAESIESTTNSVESTTNPWSDRALAAARVILNAIPTPARPTLADMTPEERAACQWMQADTKLWGRVVIIVPDLSDGRAALLDRSGDVIYGRYVNVTPRPDLPRLEWPDDEKPEDVTPVKVGDVIESADDPRIAALPVGSILLDCEGEVATNRSVAWTGRGYVPNKGEGDKFGPWTVLHIPKEADQ